MRITYDRYFPILIDSSCQSISNSIEWCFLCWQFQHCYGDTWTTLRAWLRATLRAALWPTLHAKPRSDARRANNCYCATAPLDWRKDNAGYKHMEIEAPPLVPAAGSNDPHNWAAAVDLTRSAEVCYTAGLHNAGCATRLRRQALEEQRGSDPCWDR